MSSDAKKPGVSGDPPENVLADLQMRLTFQEDEIRQLNQGVERQRVELNALNAEVARLKKLVSLPVPAEVRDRDGETPPHY